MARNQYYVYIETEDSDELFATVTTQDIADRLIAALYTARNRGIEAELIDGRRVLVVPADANIELR